MSEQREATVAAYYGLGGLQGRIVAALRQAGIDPATVKPEQLAPVDEFHMGGRRATMHVVGLMNLPAGAHVLDVGSGLGGLARYLASEAGCRVTGIDLTPEYVDVARALTDMTGLAGKAEFHVGSALDMPWGAGTFDAAVTFHVAMNIADRARLYAEVARVLKPGAVFASFDVMKGAAEGMLFPVPWAESAETSHLVTPARMRGLLEGAGFAVTHEEDWTPVGLAHHRERMAAAQSAGGPPALGFHLLLGENGAVKTRNMISMLEAGQIVVGAALARKAG